MLSAEMVSTYGQRTRLRVMGLCWQNERLLLLNMGGLNAENTLWIPPGGGVNFGEAAAQAVVREFKEETGLDVSVSRFCFAYEFINPALHALELFFEVALQGGELTLGKDPETTQNFLKTAEWIDETVFQELKTSPHLLHGIFSHCSSLRDLQRLKGLLCSIN